MEADLRYPVGRFERPATLSDEQRKTGIEEIAGLPERLRAAVRELSDQQLDTAYRPGGWTVRQLVHHLADSHMNSYVRFKLGLTENEPTVKTYDEKLWADLRDAQGPVEPSLALIENLHERWALLLRAFTPVDWERTIRHPESGVLRLDQNLALYAWHGRHHVAHITSLRKHQGW